MARGIRVRTAAGIVSVDTSYRVGRMLGYVDVSADGSMTHDGFSQGTPTWSVVPLQASSLFRFPRVTFSGPTMIWTYPSISGVPNGVCRIFYGVI